MPTYSSKGYFEEKFPYKMRYSLSQKNEWCFEQKKEIRPANGSHWGLKEKNGFYDGLPDRLFWKRNDLSFVRQNIKLKGYISLLPCGKRPPCLKRKQIRSGKANGRDVWYPCEEYL